MSNNNNNKMFPETVEDAAKDCHDEMKLEMWILQYLQNSNPAPELYIYIPV